jgi:hypothetical protein
MFIKLSLTCRKAFLIFKEYAKQGKVKHLAHRDHGDGVSKHFVRRICARRIGKVLETLDFEFSALNDDHIKIAQLPATLKALNLNGCREISERSLVQISEQCKNLERIELYWNCRVSNFGVRRLAQGCPNLKIVNFSGCKYLSDNGVIPVI